MLQSMRSAAKYVWIILIVAFVGGFLLVESSGLLNRDAVTPTTAIAEVNGDKILATTSSARSSSGSSRRISGRAAA